jgi:predicted HTH domain antitoxin
MQVTLDVPEQFCMEFSPAELGRKIKLYAALTMYHSGSLSAGAACEFAGVDRLTFIAACKQHNIPMINYEPGELASEVAAFRKAS